MLSVNQLKQMFPKLSLLDICVAIVHDHSVQTLGGRSCSCRRFGSKHQSVSFKNETQEYQRFCAILEVPENADQEQVRQSYIKLAKKFHPDSGSPEASSSKFHEIDEAYKYLQKMFADFRHNRHKIEGEYGLYYQERNSKSEDNSLAEEDESSHIKHTVPQHRQYLSYEGVGIGTPYQREKDYQKHRASKAVENLYDHRIEKLSKTGSTIEETALATNKREARKGATRYGFDRLVEDLIQESMAKGDFENLSGSGKPFKHTSTYNPYVDFTTHKLNQVLIENGFTPEWILLEKEIRQEIVEIRNILTNARHRFDKKFSGLQEEAEWNRILQQIKLQVDNLNLKINKYNLVVPVLFKQIVPVGLERELCKVVANFSEELRDSLRKSEYTSSDKSTGTGHNTRSNNHSTFLSDLFLFFTK